jgi:hypothetical protein
MIDGLLPDSGRGVSLSVAMEFAMLCYFQATVTKSADLADVYCAIGTLKLSDHLPSAYLNMTYVIIHYWNRWRFTLIPPYAQQSIDSARRIIMHDGMIYSD